MSTCIICGAPVEGHVCGSHEQDVCFEFEGSRPDQLTPGRYYRGSVDGFAEFGVFVDVGDHVTGLLHTSELDQRLESLDWDPGDTVYVQVKSVRDDGNVDLGWSIRQHPSEFRGVLVDHPEGDRLPEGESEETESSDSSQPADSGGSSNDSRGSTQSSDDSSESDQSTRSASTAAVTAGGGSSATAAATSEDATVSADESDAETETTDDAEPVTSASELERTPIADLDGLLGEAVAIEGTVAEARQTSGPTVFEVRDETGNLECAAFESAGVRAYPEIDTGDVIRLVGVLEERRDDLQIETESIEALTDEDRETVEERLEAALEERARPDSVELLADDEAVAAVRDELVAAATAIRRAIVESRPVVLRHSATVDGYAAAAAIERAAIPLVREEHDQQDAPYRYVSRRPLDGRIYGMRDAVRDVSNMLEAEERHGEAAPLFVFVNAASTTESRDGLSLLETYDAERVVVEGAYPDAEMEAEADVFANPHLAEAAGADGVSTTALGANVAAHVSPSVREEIGHLPAVSYWQDAPESYLELAEEAGYDADRVEILREAIALEAFYQTYDDKRELVADLLFGDGELADRASDQFDERVAAELRTAGPHLEAADANGAAVGVLDVDAFTHTYDFPPVEVLLEQLRAREGLDAVAGVDEDRLYVQSGTAVDMREVGKRVADAVPDGGVETRGGRDGHLLFLSGERDAVEASAVDAVADQIA